MIASGRLLLMVLVLVVLYLIPPVLDVFCDSCWVADVLMRHSWLYSIYVLGVSVAMAGAIRWTSSYRARTSTGEEDHEGSR